LECLPFLALLLRLPSSSLGIAVVSIVVFDGDEEEKKMKRWDTP
jgi:hypothetical protein